VTREYTWGLNYGGGIGGLLNLKQGGNDYNYLYDGKGNVTALIDSTQSPVVTYAYDPFGVRMKQVGTFEQPYQFSTKPYDPQTGLSNFDFRYYNAGLGRWMTRDPLGERGGINLYGFTLNNPLNWSDPYGLLSEVIIWQPVGWGASSFGHASVNVDGITYTYGPKGMTIMPTADYLARNSFREGVGAELKLTAAQEAKLQACLANYNGVYYKINRNCTHPIQECLKEIGIDLGTNYLPTSLGNSLIDSGLVSKFNFYPATTPTGGSKAPWAR
jgi:RHS repeat-associated protein